MTALSATPVLLGKTIVHSWTEGPLPSDMPKPAFETSFCSTERLVWNNVTDPAAITGQAETYTTTTIAPGIVQINWKESPETTNLGVVWTLNFNAGRIHGVIVNGNPEMNLVLSGLFELRDGLASGPGRIRC